MPTATGTPVPTSSPPRNRASDIGGSPEPLPPTPTAEPEPSCNDTPPDSDYSCQEQLDLGKCGDSFMFSDGAPDGGYCAATCNRCPPGTSPTPSPTPSSSPSASPATSRTPAATPMATPVATPVVTPAATSPGYSPTDTPSPAAPTGPSPGAPSPAPAATTASTPAPTCKETPPDSQHTCQQQRDFGKCGDPFMFAAGAPPEGYCAATCNRCPPGTSPSNSPTLAASPSVTPAASPAPAFSPVSGASPSSPAPAPSPAPAACTDLAPDAHTSCAEQAGLSLLVLAMELALALVFAF